MEPPGTAPGSDPLIASAFMSIVPSLERSEYRESWAILEGFIARIALDRGRETDMVCAMETLPIGDPCPAFRTSGARRTGFEYRTRPTGRSLRDDAYGGGNPPEVVMPPEIEWPDAQAS